MVVRIIPCSNDGIVKEPTLVKRIPDSIITVAGKRFKFKCLVRHHGDLDEASAHYVAWVKKDKKWMSVSDTDIKTESKWPSNGYDYIGTKSPYLLFYTEA